MDVLDPTGEQIRKNTDFPSVPPSHALAYAEQYLRTHRQTLIEEFEGDA